MRHSCFVEVKRRLEGRVPGSWGWIAIGVAGWLFVSVLAGLRLGRVFARRAPRVRTAEQPAGAAPEAPAAPPRPGPVDVAPDEGRQRRVLVVDDDPALRLLLRTTLADDRCAVEEAASAEDAAALVRFWRPAVVVLDVGLPGVDGLSFSRELERDPTFGSPTVILLTGAETTAEQARRAGADALLRKPFSPLDLVTLVERLTGDGGPGAVPTEPEPVEGEQLLAYARDLARLLQTERRQRRLLQLAYRQTATVLGDALEARNPLTGRHALRVHRYALTLTQTVEPRLLDDPSLEYGYLLHDVGKIGVPDHILDKPGPLDPEELRIMRRHPLIGAQLLEPIALLQGEGLRVIRSHHERWDGGGYPDGLAGGAIPLGARIFAVADALDAMTSDRPYRGRRSWKEAVDELLACDGSHFDPGVIAAFAARHDRLHQLHDELGVAA